MNARVHGAGVDAGLLAKGASSIDTASNSSCESEQDRAALRGGDQGSLAIFQTRVPARRDEGDATSTRDIYSAIGQVNNTSSDGDGNSSQLPNSGSVNDAPPQRPAFKGAGRGRGGGAGRGKGVRAAMLPTLLLSCAMAGVQPADGKHAQGLCLGSNDPHMLGGEEGLQWPQRRRSAFSILAHAEASPEELMARPFVRMNEPPLTDPLPPPELLASAPPIVTRLDEIIPPSTQRSVSLWRRRWRRCRILAAKGLFSQARRMRPPDLWLPSSEHQTEATRPWAWDLTPLTRGEPARPFLPSGRDGSDPDTGLKLPALRQAKQRGGFGDEAILDEMIQGVRDDVSFDPSRHGTLLCAPHLSALRDWSVASERTAASVQKGWAYEAHLPCWPINVCPYGVVDESVRAGEPKWRLTNDLSWPPPGALPDGGGEFVSSHNASIDRSAWPPARMIHVRDVAEAAAIMQLSEAPVKLWSVDCEAFYRKMGRQRAEIWRNAMAVADGFQVDKRCCFGSAADAAKCARVSNFLAHEGRAAMAAVDQRYPSRDRRVLEWQRARREACPGDDQAADLGRVGLYIDDAPACSFDDLLFETDGTAVWRDGVHLTRAQAHFDAFCEMLLHYGHSSKPSKEQRPSMSVEVLGVEIDLQQRRMWLSPRTAARYQKRVLEAAAEQRMPKVEYLRLMGRLQFAAAVFPRGRQWLHAAWRVARARFRLAGDQVQITARVRGDFRRWARALENPKLEGVPLAARKEVGHMGETGVGAIYADASGEYGWAAWTVADGTLLWCGDAWSPAVRDQLHINEKELFASTAGLMALAPAARLSGVLNFTDNTVAMSAMRSCTAQSARMQELCVARVDWMLTHGVNEAALRVSTHHNLWADMGSRNRAEEMERQAEALGLRVQRVSTVAQMQTADHLVALHGDSC